MSNQFPQGFLWGAAVAGHQVEGNNVNSDTWFAENVTPTVFKERSGLACDSYNRWEEDLDLVKSIGLNTYRFSLEWARIQPTQDTWDEAEIAHYEAILDGCKARGLTTVVTMNHFTSPHWFAKLAGWLNPDAPQLFATYCAEMVRRLGSRIDYVVTLNEPDLPRMLSWHNLPQFVRDLEAATVEAAGKAAGVENYRLSNVMLPAEMDEYAVAMEAGHRAARAAMKAVKPELPIGLSVAIIDDQVVGDNATVRDRKREEVYGRWLRLAREDDFLGIQNYERNLYDGNGAVEPPADAIRNQLGGEIYAPSLANCVEYGYSVSGVPVLVTEHGMSTTNDAERAAFVPDALDHLRKTIDAGVPVLGYIHWSLLDNFEWIFGYDPQFGIVHVDRQTLARTPKPTAAILGKIAQANAV